MGTMPARLDAARLCDRLVQITATGAGLERQALGDDEAAVWRLLLGWAAAGGLVPSVDPVGNLFLTLPGEDDARPPILLGSHLDTVPGGVDGAFGMLAALEAALGLAAAGRVPVRDVVVVAWMNAAGRRFPPGLMGSSTFTGARSLAASRAEADAAGLTVGAAVAARLAQFPALPRRALGFSPAFYLEAQVGTGPALHRQAVPIGVVAGLLGRRSWASAAAFIPAVQDWGAEILRRDPAVQLTIGRDEAGLIDLRHPETAVLDRLAAGIEALARDHSAPCTRALIRLSDDPATVFDASLRRMIAEAARARGHASLPLLAAEGHDGRYLAPVCPSAMLFIPGQDAPQVAAGAAVLADVLWRLAVPDGAGG